VGASTGAKKNDPINIPNIPPKLTQAEVSQFLFKETLGNANFRKILALSNVSF
jgi:hypothetical protein